jgi:ribonuclease R
MKNLKQEITSLFKGNADVVLSYTDITTALKIGGKDRKRLRKVLGELAYDGDLRLQDGHLYGLPSQDLLVKGRLEIMRSGNGLVANGADKVFVSKHDMGIALPKDTVLVQMYPGTIDSPKGAEGRVIIVEERNRHDIVGTFKRDGNRNIVIPLNEGYTVDFTVIEDKGAVDEDRVLIRLISWENEKVNPLAEIVDVLGKSTNPSLDTTVIIKEYELPEEFPQDVLAEAESVSALMDEPGKRLDWTKELTVTIDPVTARDFDDALSLHKDENGNRVLGVHIADVSHFVRPQSALDQEAFLRGNSTYLVDKVIPMLPEQLSNGVCSLNPDVERLAFSVFITLDQNADVLDSVFAKTVIKSDRRLTYEKALDILENRAGKSEKAAIKKLVCDLSKMSQQVRKNRFAKFALNLEIPEVEMQINEKGLMTGFHIVPNDISHQLVEEAMILANECVAKKLHVQNCPSIARLHEPPDEEKLTDLTEQLLFFGYSPGDLSNQKNLSKFLDSVKDDPFFHHIGLAVLKSMNRAVYSAEDTGHYGLAKKFYQHFTSPIRRYPDLIAHRQLAAILLKEKGAVKAAGGAIYKKKELSAIAIAATNSEFISADAEKALLEIKKYRYLDEAMKAAEPKPFDAVVVKVVAFGMFVEIPDLMLQGLIHVSEVSDSYARYSRTRQTLSDGKKTYKMGDKVKVVPVKVDFNDRKIDFNLAD